MLSHRSTPLWTSVFFCGCTSNDQVLSKASPRVIFSWKNFTEQLLVVRNILKWMLIEERRRPSMLSSMCQHDESLTLRCGPSRVPGCKFRFCVQQMIWYWDHMSHPGFLNWFDTGIVCQLIYRCPFIPQSCIEALTIEPGLSLPFTFRYKKAGLFAPLRMSRPISHKRWHCAAGRGAPWGLVVIESPECGKIAVWQLCKERQPLRNSHDSWWPELKMFGSMPLCSFPRQKLLPKLGQKNCHTTTWI